MSPEWRLAVWALALAIDTGSPLVGFVVPGLGRSTTADWTVEGGHMAERCGLFVIIALGESILITGATFAGLAWNAVTFAAFANCFVGSVAMWVVYFNIGAERSSRVVRRVGRPGPARALRLHLPAHPDRRRHHRGGGRRRAHAEAPGRPYRHQDRGRRSSAGRRSILLGNSLFKWLTAPYAPLSHTVGLGLLALLILAVPYPAAARAVGRHDRRADPGGGLGMAVARGPRRQAADRALSLAPAPLSSRA